MGEQLHKYENLLNRDFHAETPNSKWVTDISYIQTKQGVLYLSMIRDLYDNSIVAYKTGTEQNVNLVLDTIRQAVLREKLQDRNGTKRESGSGYYPPGSPQRKEEGRRGVAAPQRPGCSVRLTSIF